LRQTLKVLDIVRWVGSWFVWILAECARDEDDIDRTQRQVRNHYIKVLHLTTDDG
jgi:hypothetical protein